MAATSTSKAAKPKAYTVPLLMEQPLTVGWHKITLKATSSLTKAMLSRLQSTPGTWFWDRVMRGKLTAAAAKAGVKIKVPTNSFFMNSLGQIRSTVASGYQYMPRKGYDAKTGTFHFWIEVQGAL